MMEPHSSLGWAVGIAFRQIVPFLLLCSLDLSALHERVSCRAHGISTAYLRFLFRLSVSKSFCKYAQALVALLQTARSMPTSPILNGSDALADLTRKLDDRLRMDVLKQRGPSPFQVRLHMEKDFYKHAGILQMSPCCRPAETGRSFAT